MPAESSPLMPVKRAVFAYLGVCLALSLTGLVLSYGLFESAPWYWSYGALPFAGTYQDLGGIVEGIRFILLAVCFTLVQIQLFGKEAAPYWTTPTGVLSFYQNLARIGSRRLKATCLAAALAILIYHAVLGPMQLRDAFAEHVLRQADTRHLALSFVDHVAPYLGYMPYSAVNYLLLILPSFIVIVDAIRRDRRTLNAIVDEMRKLEEGAKADEDPVSRAVHLESHMLTLGETLRDVANRYLFTASLVWFYFMVELGTNMLGTLACWAQELTKWSAWLFILAVVPYFLLRAMLRQNSALGIGTRVLSQLAEATGEDTAALKEINEKRRKLQDDFSLPALLWMLAKGGSLAVFLLVTCGVPLAKYMWEHGNFKARGVVEQVLPWPVASLSLNVWQLLAPTDRQMPQDGVPCPMCATCTRRTTPATLLWHGKPVNETAGGPQ